MISKTQNINLVNEIASLYCGTNTLCVANTKSRLMNNLNDYAFELFVNVLNQGRTYYAVEAAFKAGGNNTSSILISYVDIITGEKGSGWIQGIPNDYIFSDPRNWDAILAKSNLTYLGSFNIGTNGFLLINNPALASYDLSKVSKTDTTDIGTILNPPVKTPVTPIPSSSTQSIPDGTLPSSDSDLEKYLLPGLIVLGIYLLVKD